MSNELIKKEYKKKLKLINQYNKKYYDDNVSEVSDSEYDYLKEEILSLEKKYNLLDHKNSPSINVGYKPSKNFQKVSHKVPMLSLSNAFNEEDLNNFLKKIMNYLDLDRSSTIEFSAEPKIDGISASLIYKKG